MNVRAHGSNTYGLPQFPKCYEPHSFHYFTITHMLRPFRCHFHMQISGLFHHKVMYLLYYACISYPLTFIKLCYPIRVLSGLFLVCFFFMSAGQAPSFPCHGWFRASLVSHFSPSPITTPTSWIKERKGLSGAERHSVSGTATAYFPVLSLGTDGRPYYRWRNWGTG